MDYFLKYLYLKFGDYKSNFILYFTLIIMLLMITSSQKISRDDPIKSISEHFKLIEKIFEEIENFNKKIEEKLISNPGDKNNQIILNINSLSENLKNSYNNSLFIIDEKTPSFSNNEKIISLEFFDDGKVKNKQTKINLKELLNSKGKTKKTLQSELDKVYKSNITNNPKINEIIDNFQKQIYSMTSNIESILNIKTDDNISELEIVYDANNKKISLKDENNLLVKNSEINLFNLPKDKIKIKSFSNGQVIKSINATFFEPKTFLRNRELVDFEIVGSMVTVFSEQDIYKLLPNDKNDNKKNDPSSSNVIAVIKNQYLANRFIDVNNFSYNRLNYNCIVIGADLENNQYKISNFITENLPNVKRPYFFISLENFWDIADIIDKFKHENLVTNMEIHFNNMDTFFPKDYLLSMNYFLMILMIIMGGIWILMCLIFRKFYNLLHKWFSGMLVLKILYTLIIISNLNILFKKTNDEDELYFDFMKILFETILVSLNCIFKSFFLFVFFLIFEGFKIFKDNLSRIQTKKLVFIFMLFYISFCIDQFLDFDVENKIGYFKISEVKNLFFFILYQIIIQYKASKSIEFLAKKLIYARLFIREFVEQIKIKSNYLRICRVISPLYIVSYFIFTIIFRLSNEIDDDFTKHYVLIHHNFIECLVLGFLIMPYIPRKFPANFNEFIFENLENLEKINFYKVIIRREKRTKIQSLDSDSTNNSSNVKTIESEEKEEQDNDCNSILKEKISLNEKNPEIKVDFNLKSSDLSLIEDIKGYQKIKNEIQKLNSFADKHIFKNDFPIVILNPGFEYYGCLTEKMSIGNIN